MSVETNEYVERAMSSDNIRSIQAELIRSRDYGDQRIYPDAKTLREVGRYWLGEQDSELRSPRCKEQIGILMTRLIFELGQREEH